MPVFWRETFVTLAIFFSMYVLSGLVLFRWTDLLGSRSLTDIVAWSFIYSVLLAFLVPLIRGRMRRRKLDSRQ